MKKSHFTILGGVFMLCHKFTKNFTVILFLILFSGFATGQETSKTTKQELEALKNKVVELENTIVNLKSQLDSTALKKEQTTGELDESALEKELAKELGLEETNTQTVVNPAQPAAVQGVPSEQRSLFQNMNPNVSVIGTVLGSGTSLQTAERNVNLSFEEAEFSFQAAVDPYARADFYIAFGKHAESSLAPSGVAAEEGGEEGGLESEIEEAYLTILSLPFSTQIKAGKFRSHFGKINETHPHAYNFIDVPLMYSHFLGAEGLNDEGVSLSWLIPNSAFYQELTIQVTSGPAENASFTRAENNRLLYLAHLKNFFDLNENTTLELGFTGLSGPNSEKGDLTQMFAADLTLKWKPLQRNRYKSFEFINEFLISKRHGGVEDVTSFGLYSFLRYQTAKRWFVGALYDYSEFPEFSGSHHQAFSGILQYFTTEFQKLEFQYKFNESNFFDSFSEIKLRAVFVIGAHGAHKY